MDSAKMKKHQKSHLIRDIGYLISHLNLRQMIRLNMIHFNIRHANNVRLHLS